MHAQINHGSVRLENYRSDEFCSQIDDIAPFGILEQYDLDELEAVEAVRLNDWHDQLLLKVQVLGHYFHIIWVVLYQLLGRLGQSANNEGQHQASKSLIN